MLSVLRHPVYRSLFAAQVLSLIGTGLTTVALALLAYNTEALVSPALAAALLAVTSYSNLFPEAANAASGFRNSTNI